MKYLDISRRLGESTVDQARFDALGATFHECRRQVHARAREQRLTADSELVVTLTVAGRFKATERPTREGQAE